MAVVRLGERYTTQYVPDELIEGYSSCIWTERCRTPGQFEIKTPHIDKMKALLPEDTLISHLDTEEVMMVENHAIAVNEEGVPELVITGQDLKTMLDHRYVESRYQKKRKMRRNYTASAGLGVLLYQAFDNGSGKDVTRGDPNPWDENDTSDTDYSWNTLDKIPNISITDSVTDDGSAVAKRWWLEEGLLGPQFLILMNKHKVWLRTIRPSSGSSAKVMTVKATPLADRGEVVRTQTSGITSLRFDLYKGMNRSHSQSTNPKVAFSVLQGDLGQPQYLWSRKDYKTIVEIISSIGINDQARAGEADFSGWKRRVDQLDAGAPDIPDEPQRPKDPRKNATQAERQAFQDDLDKWRDRHDKWVNRKNSIIAEFKEDTRDDADNLLDMKRRVVMLSGDVSTHTPFQFKTHYDLGDRVSIHGDYGMEEEMIVEEYVRTEDSENGDRGYPGLVAP